jgi:hypothetical protein
MQQTWSECLKRLQGAPDAALEWSRSGVEVWKNVPWNDWITDVRARLNSLGP